jgi:hypothetical protein
MNEWYAANGGGIEGRYNDKYGDTFIERLKNLPLAMWNGEFGKLPEGTISLSMTDNPISLLMPFSQFSKVSLGLKSLGGASKTTLVTSSFFREIGISGSMSGRWFTPLGPASNWETFLGRWTPFIMTPGLIYEKTKNDDERY